jgi:hypothetical protein
MAGGNDHRQPPRDALKQRPGDLVAFGVGQRELLGVVGQQAQPVRPGVHQVVHDPRRTVQVEALIVVKDRRHHRHHAGQRNIHEMRISPADATMIASKSKTCSIF